MSAAIKEKRKKIYKALTSLDLKMHSDLIILAASYDNNVYPFRGDRVSYELPEHIVNLIKLIVPAKDGHLIKNL